MDESFGKFEKTDIVDGKINWRVWVPKPERLPDDVKTLLDRMAEFIELASDIKGGDDLEKFDNFKKLALSRGLITREEWFDVERSKHSAV